MSISHLQQLLADKLGERDAKRFSDVHLQNLLDKEYTDEGALQDATREGLQSPPALPAALVDKLLKAFGQSGERVHQQYSPEALSIWHLKLAILVGQVKSPALTCLIGIHGTFMLGW